MGTTKVTLLLDKSGSMGIVRDTTIEAYNGYVATLKGDDEYIGKLAAGAIDFTFLQFDTGGIDKVHVGVPIAEVPELTPAGYQPHGGTPLIDAAVKTIRAVEKVVTTGDKVVICIQTDGQENESRDHTWEELSALIREKIEAGWQFNFMGAGIDAFAQGARMGVSAMSTMSYDSADREATREAFGATARNTRAFAAGAKQNVNYSAGQRAAAGEHRTAGAAGGREAVGLTNTVKTIGSARGLSVDLAASDRDELDLATR